MAAGIASTGLDQSALHLTPALSALRGDDSNGAIHHLGHFLEMADPDQLQDGKRILALIHQGRTLDAKHQLEDFIGHMPAVGDAGHHHVMPSSPHGGHRYTQARPRNVSARLRLRCGNSPFDTATVRMFQLKA